MEHDEELQDIQERIDHLEKLTKDNNRILHKMRNQMRLATFLRLMWWILVIGSMLGAYYYLQPIIGSVIEQTTNSYNELIGIPEKIKNFEI